MKKVFLLLITSATQILQAQNVGINIITPQATLDVRGSQRTGGITNYVKYDSATGKIEWVGASLFTATSQQIIRHSASSEGLYAGGGKLDYRNSSGTPVFYSDWTNGNGYFSGNLGIGTVNPTAKLQIRDGASGITPFFSARMVVETNSHTYINLLSPDPFETGILFGSGSNAVSGLISYNSTTVPKGFIFSNNGNQTRMVIDNAGRVGIGNTSPASTLDVKGNLFAIGNFANTNTSSDDYNGIIASCNNTAGIGLGMVGYGGFIGVRGEASLTGGGERCGLSGEGINGIVNYGVFGSAGGGIESYGLFGSAGGGSGTNSFGVRGESSGGLNSYAVYGSASGGSSSNWAGFFAGNVYAAGVYQSSDRKLKSNIKSLTSALSIINQLNPSVYTYKINEYEQMHLPEGVHYGLIADEVQLIIPGIVRKVVQPAKYEDPTRHNGKKTGDEVMFNAINYTEIIPILVGAIKEQQLQINTLLKEIQLIKEKSK